MASPFIAEIKMFGGNFNPRGHAFCNGQTLPIQQNTALFSLLGTTYGGNGTTNFVLPNLQGRAVMNSGQAPGQQIRDLGEVGGAATVALTPSELPAHTHAVSVASTMDASADRSNASGNVLAKPGDSSYATTGTAAVMNSAAISNAGSGQPHNNMQPYLAINFIIALQGVYPARN